MLQLAKDSHLSKVRLEKHIHTATESYVFIAQPARYSDYILGGRRLSRTLESFRKEITDKIIRATLLLTLLMMLLAFLASTYFLIPVNQLILATNQIIIGNYDTIVPENHPDEFSDIADTFNLMTGKLKEGKLLKTFVAASLESQLDKQGVATGKAARREEVAIIFSSIINFKKSLSEAPPEQVYKALKHHLEAATEVSENFAGEIDKMIEDKVMMVFTNQPGGESNSERAIQAAKQLSKGFFELTGHRLAIGINSGTVICGIMGAETVRLAKTVVGDPVNLAARLAGVAETMPNGGLVASQQTLQQANSGHKFEKLDIATVKGKTQKVEIFKLVS